MTRNSRIVLSATITVLGALVSPATAGAFDPVAYVLRTDSALIDDCHCGRLAFQIPLEGTFTLTRLAVPFQGEVYSITDIAFEGHFGEQAYHVTGGGQYTRMFSGDTGFSLDLTLNDVSGIHMEGQSAEPAAVWPNISATATEDGTRNGPQFFHIVLVASPASSAVRYDAAPGDVGAGTGSILVDECLICGRAPIAVPMEGSFTLFPIEVGGPNPFNRYEVDSLELKSASPDVQYDVSGGGIYQWGGEVAITQLMLLQVTVNGGGVGLAADAAAFPQGVSFPTIDVELHHLDPVDLLHVYTLHLVAKPTDEPPRVDFRRGDSNGDGTVDISDAVFTLVWLFAGGPAPGCLDAADANGDLNHDLSDAVFALDFLFRGGDGPPAPGAANCGPATSGVGCESYPACKE